MSSKIIQKVNRFVTNDFTVRISAVDATEVVQEMQTIQACYPLATVGVGRAMVGALLMASNLKDGQEVGLLFKGNGPLGSVYAQANFNGQVRGYCPNPLYQAPNNEDALVLGKALGFGHLTVARHQPFQRQPFQGTVSMTFGEIGEDLAHYLHQSHQIRSMVSLGVYIDPYGKVKAAGGLIIEVMPGVEDEIVTKIQANTEKHKVKVSQMILDGAKPLDLVKPYLEGLFFTQIPHDFDISYFCPCTTDRVKGAMTILGEQGLQEMIEENKPAEVTCQMCGRKYELEVSELVKLKDEVRKGSMH
jgi:molecular chaperone Hsp33